MGKRRRIINLYPRMNSADPIAVHRPAFSRLPRGFSKRAVVIAALLGLLGLPAAKAARPPDPLSIRSVNQQLQLTLPREPIPPLGGTRYRLHLESTADLRSWTPVGELGTDDTGVPALTLDPGSPYSFFRIAPVIELGDASVGGADLWGFNRIFTDELRAVGYLTPAEFIAANASGVGFLERIGFDPRSAAYWDAFNADPKTINQGKKYGDAGWRSWDFRLNDSELALFLRNGFVVSPRLGSENSPNRLSGTTGQYQVRSTFADIFYRVFNDDLPVFISADAALHAWHYSFARMLSEIEQTHLAYLLGRMLDAMAGSLSKVPAEVRSGPWRDHLADADYFLAVARSLLAGVTVGPVLGADPNIGQTLAAIEGLP